MKPLEWVGSAKRDMAGLPREIRQTFGHFLWEAQEGKTPIIAEVLRGFGSASVLELIKADPDGTYRAVYTVRFADAVYVLHCFQKKSKKGIATPQRDIDLIKARLAEAERKSKSKGEGHA